MSGEKLFTEKKELIYKRKRLKRTLVRPSVRYTFILEGLKRPKMDNYG